jgi:hypothetical protein
MANMTDYPLVNSYAVSAEIEPVVAVITVLLQNAPLFCKLRRILLAWMIRQRAPRDQQNKVGVVRL